MVKTVRRVALASLLIVCASAHAGITSFSAPGSGNFPGENWAQGSDWLIRAILLDSSHQPIGSLSPPASFSTIAQSLVPALATVTLDAPAAAGSIIRIYRSPSIFNAGDPNIQYADYSVCPCAAGAVSPTATQRLPDADFSASSAVLPVRLQDFQVN